MMRPTRLRHKLPVANTNVDPTKKEPMEPTAYVESQGDGGEFTPLAEASVSVLDRGFLFGDGVYEVVRCREANWFRMDRHLARLRDSAHALDIEGLPPAGRFQAIADELAGRAEMNGNGYLYIQVTRGAGPRQAAYPEVEPTVVCYVDEATRGADALREEGAQVVTVPDTRWQHCDIKSVNLLPKVMMSQHADQQKAYEALFVGDNGEIFEGTSTNIFIRQGDRLRTPSDSSRVLAGITRREVVDMVSETGLQLDFGQMLLSDATGADEVFLTGTLTEILGVVAIDGVEVDDGTVGETTRQLQAQLRDRMSQ